MHFTEEKMRKLLKKKNPKKIKRYSVCFREERYVSLFEETSIRIINETPSLHTPLLDLYLTLLLSENETLFTLYFQVLLGNRRLFDFLLNGYQVTEEEWMALMIKKAENHPEKGAKGFALGVLMVLYDSFS
jgi:hypothetical protein